jgi:hypothetical protein
MNVPITTAVMAGILSLVSGSPAFAGSIVKTSEPELVSRANSPDLVIQGASKNVPVQLHFGGAERIDFGKPGELIVIRHGLRQHYRPDVYQVIDGKWRPVAVSYRLSGGDLVTVNFGSLDNSAPVFLRNGAVTLRYH